MAGDNEGGPGRNITLWTAAMGLVGGFLGGGAEGVLKWWEFREHLSQAQQQQILEVVKLVSGFDRKQTELATDYTLIVAEGLPERARERLLTLAARSATSGEGASAKAAAQINAAFPEAVAASPTLKALLLPGHPRLFIQIARENQRSGLEKIRAGLSGSGANVDAPGIELVPRYSGPSELRYFFPEDAEQAARLASRLAASVPGLTCRRVGGYAQKAGVKPQLFELWIGPAFQAGQEGGQPETNVACGA